MNAVIFIPGYKGSKLKDRNTQQTAFLNFRHLFSTHSLGCDISGKSTTLETAGIFDEFVLPFMKIDICKKFLTKLHDSSEKIQLIEFDYDWRLDILDHVKRLHSLIQEIENKFENIYFISHSLGSYFLLYYLKYGTQEPETAKEDWFASPKIKKVITLAVPFQGIQVILKDFHYNDPLLWNKKIFHKNVSRTYPGAYQLLPQYPVPLINKNGESINIFEIQSWVKNNLSFWDGSYNDSEFLREYTLFLDSVLKRAKFFSDKINNSKIMVPEHCRVLNFIGTGITTPKRYVWDQSKKNPLVIKENEVFKYPVDIEEITGDGDGLVLKETATLPTFYKNDQSSNIFQENGHAEFLKDKAVFRRMMTFLTE